jgi:hypothetical protein
MLHHRAYSIEVMDVVFLDIKNLKGAVVGKLGEPL